MTKSIKILLWVMCISVVLAVITGGAGGSEFFIGIAMICLFLIGILVIIEMIKSS